MVKDNNKEYKIGELKRNLYKERMISTRKERKNECMAETGALIGGST